jgi:transposase
LQLHLKQIDALDEAIAGLDQEIDDHTLSFRDTITQLKTIPGVGDLGACVILSEIGQDMTRFPTHGHLLSWAGLCPGNNESAGKRRSNRMRKGDPWLKTTLIQCAWAAIRKKGSYLQAQFYRLRARRGPKKAICAVAASMLTLGSSPRASLSLPITCSKTVRFTKTKTQALTTSIAAQKVRMSTSWSRSFKASDIAYKSHSKQLN